MSAFPIYNVDIGRIFWVFEILCDGRLYICEGAKDERGPKKFSLTNLLSYVAAKTEQN